MASTLGGLIVTLGLDAAEFVSGLTRSQQKARAFGQAIGRGIRTSVALATAGLTSMATAAVGATYAIDKLVKQAARYKDLEEETGASAEALASFQAAADNTGTSVEEIAKGMQRLSKNLAGVTDDSDEVGAAIQALGLDINKFRQLDPTDRVLALADALSQFADLDKEAVTQVLFGRTGANLQPFFNELVNGLGQVKILTQEQIVEADRFVDAQAKVKSEISLTAQSIAIEAIPAVTGLIGASKDYIEALAGINVEATQLAGNRALRDWFEGIAVNLARIIDAIDGAVRAFQILGKTIGAAFALREVYGEEPLRVILGLSTRAKAITEAFREDIEQILERPFLSRQLEARFAQQRATEEALAVGPPAPPRIDTRPRIKFEGANTGEAVKQAKAVLENALKDQERIIRAEEDLLKDRQAYLEAYYQDNLITLQEYYTQRLALQEGAQRKIIAALDEEIRLQRQYTQRRDLKPEQREAAETKLADLIYQRQRREAEGAREIFDINRDNIRAMQEYADTIASVDAEMKQLAGDTAAAAAVRFEQQNRRLRQLSALPGGEQLGAQLDALKAQEIARASLTDATQRYQIVADRSYNAQRAIDQELRSGAITTLQAYEKRAEVARQYIGVLQLQADAAYKAAMAMQPGPEQEAALNYVDRLRAEIKDLEAVTNELADEFRRVFTDAFADSLTEVVNGTKSVSEAFRDMERQIVAALTRIAAQNIAESIFGKQGLGGGIADIFGPLSNIFTSGGGALGNLFSGFSFFQKGGPIAANQTSIVGEEGPEVFTPKAAGNIIPFVPRGETSNPISISVNVAPSMSRATADQVATETARAVRRAATRNM